MTDAVIILEWREKKEARIFFFSSIFRGGSCVGAERGINQINYDLISY